jgi:hypothetical protein
MNMQQFTGWVTRLLDALPWRRAQRAPSPLMRERVTLPPKANRFGVPDDHDIKRQKAETNPLCSTLHEDLPADHEPLTPQQPLLLPAPLAPDSASAPLMALPALPATGAGDAASPSEPTDEPQLFQADPERRLAFARYLFRRGVFNEGFSSRAVPAQYRDQVPQDRS